MPRHTLHLHILILYYICIVHIYTELILQYNLHTPVHSTIYTFTVHICTSYHIRQHISVCIDTCSYSLHTVCINTLLTNIPCNRIDKVSMSLWKKFEQSHAVYSIYPRISLSNQREKSQFKL